MGNLDDKWREEIKKLSDLELANRLVKYSNGKYVDIMRDEAIARILMRTK